MDIKKIQHILGKLAEVNEQLMSLADGFISNRGKPLFTHQPEKLRVAQPLRAGFYTEVNMSANSIKETLIQVLDYFSIDEGDVKIYLREDRDAD